MKSDEERFWEKVEKTDTCWLWTAGKTNRGYGAFYPTGSKQVGVHRWSYEHHVGPIPDGLQIDHLCRNRACVRPDHLEAVTQAVNLARGESPTAITARAGVCHRGHSLDNSWTADGRRHCKECHNINRRRRRQNQIR